MSVFKTSIPIAKIFENQSGNAVSDPIGCADFKSIEFSLVTSNDANFSVRCIGSLQNNPPDPSVVVGANNDYNYVVFTSESESASYNATSPLVVSGAISKIYRFNTEGLRWAFVEIFSHVAGSVVVSNVVISDNE